MPKSQSFKGVITVRLPMLQCLSHTSDCIGSTGWSWWGINKRGLEFEGVRWACVRKKNKDVRVKADGFTTNHALTFAVRMRRLLLFLSLPAQTVWSPLPSRPELGMLVAWRRSAQMMWSWRNRSFLVWFL